MPLRIEPESLRGIYPDEITDTFAAIKAEVGNAAITPRIALNLIRKHFLPLDVQAVGEALSIRKQADWNTVEFVGIYLIAAGYRRGEESALAFAIHDFFRYSRSPKPKAKTIDPTDVFSYCHLCWRHSVTYRTYCYFHNPATNNTNYRYALRKKTEFDKMYDKIARYDLEEFNRTNNSYRDFFPRESQKAWLADIRPNVWNLVSPRIGSCPDGDFLRLLLREIDWIPEETKAQQDLRSRLHEKILKEPHLITRMLRKAEAWIVVEQNREKSRGGKRNNAGKKGSDRDICDQS